MWPDVAIWAIESVAHPNSVGWWALSGDLPCDYTSCGRIRHPREGLRDIARRWKKGAESWAKDQPSPGWSIGAPQDRQAIAPLLATRADMLISLADDDDLWPDD